MDKRLFFPTLIWVVTVTLASTAGHAASLCRRTFTERPALERELAWRARDVADRAAAFARKFPGRVAFLRRQEVVSNRRPGGDRNIRDILVISTRDVPSSELESIRRTFVQDLSDHVVSPLLSTRFEHLRIRFGEKIRDMDPELKEGMHLHTADFGLTTRERMEPLIALTDAEKRNFDRYIENIEAAPLEVIGPGRDDVTVTSENVRGRLDDNRFQDENVHNCTSWFMMAPVGADGSPLYRLLGAPAGLPSNYRVFSSIKRTAHFLAFVAPSDRVPTIVIWTNKSLEDVNQRLQTQPETLDSYVFPWR